MAQLSSETRAMRVGENRVMSMLNYESDREVMTGIQQQCFASTQQQSLPNLSGFLLVGSIAYDDSIHL